MIKFLVAFNIAIWSLVGYQVDTYAADKKVVKTDCTNKKNAKKIECQKAPEPKKKVEAKKPKKVERKAPKSVQQKAAEETAKK